MVSYNSVPDGGGWRRLFLCVRGIVGRPQGWPDTLAFLALLIAVNVTRRRCFAGAGKSSIIVRTAALPPLFLLPQFVCCLYVALILARLPAGGDAGVWGKERRGGREAPEAFEGLPGPPGHVPVSY